jgi:hypothetical protein
VKRHSIDLPESRARIRTAPDPRVCYDTARS